MNNSENFIANICKSFVLEQPPRELAEKSPGNVLK